MTFGGWKMTGFRRGARWLVGVALLALVAACAPAAAEPTTQPSAAPSGMPADVDLPLPPDQGAEGPGLPAPPPASGTGENLSGDCNTTSWTWPLCDLGRPTRPTFRAPGRPELTPKDNVWCTASVIKASGSGYTYWVMTSHRKIVLRLWPDYYECMFYAMYWDGSQWRWLPYDKNYPNAIVGQLVYCDA